MILHTKCIKRRVNDFNVYAQVLGNPPGSLYVVNSGLTAAGMASITSSLAEGAARRLAMDGEVILTPPCIFH